MSASLPAFAAPGHWCVTAPGYTPRPHWGHVGCARLRRNLPGGVGEEVTRLLLERGVEGGAQAIPLTLQ
jgi:hypothetical protein